MIERARGALPGTKPDCVAPGILDLLEQFGSTVTVQRTGEIYGQGKPTEFCWRILSGCVRTVKLMVGGWKPPDRRIPMARRSVRHG